MTQGVSPNASVAFYFKPEPNIAHNTRQFLKLLELNDNEKFKKGALNLVLGYFNKYLNGKPENFDDEALDVEHDDDGNQIWHAEMIGAGGFGTVFKLTKRNPITKQIESTKAIKVILNSTIGLSEAINAAKMNHPNVVKVHNVMLVRHICCVEMEYLPLGTLQHLIDALENRMEETNESDSNLVKIVKEGPNISSQVLFKMLFQSCEVLLMMRQNEMVHSDIKPENIMIKKLNMNDPYECEIAIGDFGFTLQQETLMEQFIGGTDSYRAPELLFGKPTFHSDLYALGITFSKLLVFFDDVDEFLFEIIENLSSPDTKEREQAFYKIGFNGVLVYKMEKHSIWGIENKFSQFLSLKYDDLNLWPSCNKEFIEQCALLEFSSCTLSNDEQLVTNIIASNKSQLIFAHESLRKNGNFIENLIIKYDDEILDFVDESFWKDKEFILRLGVMKQILGYIDEKLWSERDFVLSLIKKNCWAFLYLGIRDELNDTTNDLRKDRQIVLEAVKQNGMSLEYADKALRADKEVVLRAVQQNGSALQYADIVLKKDKELCFKAVKNSARAFNFMDGSLRLDRSFILEIINEGINIVTYFDENILKDNMVAIKKHFGEFIFLEKIFQKEKEVMIEVVKQKGKLLKYADDLLKKDREIVLEAVKQDGCSLEYADDLLKKDREMVLEAVKQNGNSLKYADEIFKKDREIVLEVVKQNGYFEYADDLFKKDREIVLEVVKQDGYYLECADEIFKKDREIVLEAVKQNGNSLKYADEIFKKDREIVLEVVKQKGYYFEYADEILTKDREVVLEVVKQKGNSLEYADDLLKKDREIVLEAVKQDGCSLIYADKTLKKDREIVLEAVKQKGYYFEYADKTLKKDREIVLEVVKQDGYSLKYADKTLKKDREIVLEAVKRNGCSLEFADKTLKKDREIVLEAVKQNGYSLFKKDREIVLEVVKRKGSSLEYADKTLKKDREIVLEAVKRKGNSLKYADEIFKKDREIVLEAVKQDRRCIMFANESLQKAFLKEEIPKY